MRPEARGARPAIRVGCSSSSAGTETSRLDLDWWASTITGNPLSSADLPLTPPDLDLLGGGLLTVYGECTRCAAPAAFFRIEATLDSLTRPVRLSVDHDLVWWEGPGEGCRYDVVYGDLNALRAGGDFSLATEQCLAAQQGNSVLDWDGTPLPGEALWFAVRPVEQTAGTYDAYDVIQEGDRDQGIETSGRGCP